MLNKFKPISISLSPNVQKDDVKLALRLLFQPWKWKNGSTIKEFEDQFKKYLGVKYTFSFNSGRSALYAILQSLKASEGPSFGDFGVLLQAFTCNAVPNPVLWAGLNPIYIDCNKYTFNININHLRKVLQTTNYELRTLVVQHTFGLPANMDEIIKIAKEYNLTVIEDCAHALGATYTHSHTLEYGSDGDSKRVGLPTEAHRAKVGTFGKAAFFSFSRDKVISCVYGGMAVTNDDEIGEALRQAQSKMGFPNPFWIFQQLLHPILLHYIILPLYKFLDLGKLFLIASQWLHVLSKAVSWKEKRGLRPDYFPKALPNALAMMALNQFHKLEKFNAHRKEIAEFYYKELANTKFELPPNDGIFLRFAVKHPKAHDIIYEAWHKENILLGDWYTTPIAPDDTKLEEMIYKMGMCPNAEELSKITLNLPTHINTSVEDAKRIINFLRKYA